MKTHRITKLVTMIVALCLFRTLAHGATVLTGPGDFTGSTTLIDFETFPDGSEVPYDVDKPGILSDQWRSVGVLISDSTPNDGAGAYGGTFLILPHSGTRAISDSPSDVPGEFLDFHFVIPGTNTFAAVNEVGLWVENGDAGSTVSFFDLNGALIMSLNTSVGDQFAGIRADEGIGSIRINDAGFFMTDDLQFGVVPEPSSLALLAVGTVVTSWMLRRRSRFATARLKDCLRFW